MNFVKKYLSLPGSHQEYTGVSWSIRDNCLEFVDGSTLVFTDEVAEFLEGFAHVRPIVHFAFIVQLLLLLRRVSDKHSDATGAHRRLRKLFSDTGGSLRNAGAFFGQLCRDIPEAREAHHVDSICQRLRSRESLYGFLSEQQNNISTFAYVVALGTVAAELPPFDAVEFESRLTDAIQSCPDEVVSCWLKYGRAPMENAGEALAKAVPPTLAGRLASLLSRPRMNRARNWVSQLAGALALPPRRLTDQDLPMGGYSDVTTHGQVDQILLSQFALDEWDFFRRYAERELLYFRREEPHDQTRQQLVVVLDQGVRTWGDVRLALGAALLALGKQSIRRGNQFMLATTSLVAVDPLQIDETSLGEIVEASDLSPNPGLALERLLELPSEYVRDIVLLTHPRNIEEEDVRAAANRLHLRDRLFALALDRHGNAQLSELKHGVPIPIRQFHVDLSVAADEHIASPVTKIQGWSGAIEPIGFPFRFGLGGPIGTKNFDFDLEGTFLLTAGPLGVLYLWEVGGDLVEILPRPMSRGKVLLGTSFVLGVASGFVLKYADGPQLIVAHYDLGCRKCTCYPIGDGTTVFGGSEYSPEHHCLILPHVGNEQHPGLVIDLSTGERFATNLGGRMNRAQAAWIAWEKRQIAQRQLPIANASGSSHLKRSFVSVDYDSGKVVISWGPTSTDPQFKESQLARVASFTPQADGRPMLRNQLLLEAQYGGVNLALQMSPLASAHGIRIYMVRCPEGKPLGEYQMADNKLGFRLSADGTLLVRQHGASKVEISQIAGNITPIGRTRVGGFANELPFVLGHDKLLIYTGRHSFLLDWSRGTLVLHYHARKDFPILNHGIRATPENVPEPCRYDLDRWLLGATSSLLVASDRYSQVGVFDRRHNLVCMFFAFRARIAGWMPDGTRFGSATVTGQTPSQEAVTRFGRALKAASLRGES